jgi:hypothetical protein
MVIVPLVWLVVIDSARSYQREYSRVVTLTA